MNMSESTIIEETKGTSEGSIVVQHPTDTRKSFSDWLDKRRDDWSLLDWLSFMLIPNYYYDLYEFDKRYSRNAWKEGSIESPPKTDDFQEYKEQWETYIEESCDIGIFTLMIMHWHSNILLHILPKLLFLMIMFAQVAIPMAILTAKIEAFRSADYGFCPSGGQATERVVCAAVAMVYVSRVILNRSWAKIIDSYSESLLIEKKQDNPGVLMFTVYMDRFGNDAYEIILYAINLFIVFQSDRVIDIVLNALAIEFVFGLDNEAKEAYLKVFPPNALSFMHANNERMEGAQVENEMKKGGKYMDEPQPISKGLYSITMIGYVVRLGCMFWVGLLVVFGAVYLPWCKPG